MSESVSKNNLRQKTWGIFVKPFYITSSKDALICRGTIQGNVPYMGLATLQGGEPWMLYETTNSFVKAREIVKSVMDDIGIAKNDVMVAEIVPFDHLITPLA